MSLGYKYREQQQKDLVRISKSYSPRIIEYVKLLADDPFITQQQVAEHFDLSVKELIGINHIIRESDELQNYIKTNGIGSKYWTNTIHPLFGTGKLQSAIAGQHTYPERIGLYTGFSCMFYCNFCGRNYNAKYEKSLGDTSFEMFKRIIDQDPKTDANWRNRFRISGGVEPLTNPLTNDVISYGASQGFNMQLYTNGYLLTDTYMDNNPGIFDLNMIRFSIYGVDEDTTTAVTKNAKAYVNVKKNVKSFLKRKELRKETNVGLNYILLTGKVNEIFGLLDYIREINQEQDRHIDFVTIREDHSQSLISITKDERIKLIEMLHQVDEIKRQDPLLKDVHFDYGYALDCLRYNQVTGPIKMVQFKEMVRDGFPQVCLSVDIKGDVYLYHESGFIDRPGADRYIIGNTTDKTLDEVCDEWVSNDNKINPLPGDTGYLDAFDHVASILINQYRANKEFGVDLNNEPIRIINENRTS